MSVVQQDVDILGHVGLTVSLVESQCAAAILTKAALWSFNKITVRTVIFLNSLLIQTCTYLV
jgi:hypothetical protein